MTSTKMLRHNDFVDVRFIQKRLEIVGYTNDLTLWFYRSPAIADTLSENYFGPVSDMMAAGHHIHVSAPHGNVILAVESADDGVVLVRKMVG